MWYLGCGLSDELCARWSFPYQIDTSGRSAREFMRRGGNIRDQTQCTMILFGIFKSAFLIGMVHMRFKRDSFENACSALFDNDKRPKQQQQHSNPIYMYDNLYINIGSLSTGIFFPKLVVVENLGVNLYKPMTSIVCVCSTIQWWCMWLSVWKWCHLELSMLVRNVV